MENVLLQHIFFYRSVFGIALWTQPVWNSMQFNRTGQGSPLPWGPNKVLEGTGTEHLGTEDLRANHRHTSPGHTLCCPQVGIGPASAESREGLPGSSTSQVAVASAKHTARVTQNMLLGPAL